MINDNFTWRNYLKLPYESLYSIIEKFCFLNGLDTKLLFYIFRNYVNSPCVSQDFKPFYIYKNVSLTQKFIESFLPINSGDFDMLSPFSLNNYSVFLERKFRYCPKCIKYGYHSYFHQFNFLDNCFLHKSQILIKSNDMKYIVAKTSNRPYSSIIETPIVNNILNNKLLRNKLNSIFINLPEKIKIIDLNYNRRTNLGEFDLNKKTKSFLKDLFLNKINIETDYKPILSISKNMQTIYSQKLIEYYKDKYKYEYFEPSYYLSSVYLAIYDYIRKLTKDLSENEIHNLSANLRYEQEINEEDKDKYISLLTGWTLLDYEDDEIFYSLKSIWAQGAREERAYYLHLTPLEWENFNNKSEEYYYIKTIIVKSIADKIYNELYRQWDNIDISLETHIAHYYEFNLPQYVLTLQNDIFNLYEFDSI